MALKNVTIPITDHDSVCSSGYLVRYKASFETSWTIVTPTPIIPPIVLVGLLNATLYNLEISRYCCDGTTSNPTTTTFTTPA